MGTLHFKELIVYQLAEKLADVVWQLAAGWAAFEKDTLGRQLVRAVDSVGANIAEGSGRGTYQDNRRFVLYARGSLYETQHFLRQAYRRQLIPTEISNVLKPLMEELPPRLNAYLASIGKTSPQPPLPTSDQ